MAIDLWGELRTTLESEAELSGDIEVEQLDAIPASSNVKLEVGKWFEIPDVVCLYADMVDSTRLLGKLDDPDVARIHQVFTGGLTSVFTQFKRDYADIKGDGGFALWQGDFADAWAVTAGITFKTLVQDYTRPFVRQNIDSSLQLEARMGIAKGNVLVKKIGSRNRNDEQFNWLVWVGTPVNEACKLCEQARPDTIWVGDAVHSAIADGGVIEEHLIMSCGCPDGIPRNLWTSQDMNRLAVPRCWSLETKWCLKHGDAYINAVLNHISAEDDDD
jgi:class 3 adenylate cyclase